MSAPYDTLSTEEQAPPCPGDAIAAELRRANRAPHRPDRELDGRVLVVGADRRSSSITAGSSRSGGCPGDVASSRATRARPRPRRAAHPDPARFMARLDEHYADPTLSSQEEVELTDGRASSTATRRCSPSTPVGRRADLLLPRHHRAEARRERAGAGARPVGGVDRGHAGVLRPDGRRRPARRLERQRAQADGQGRGHAPRGPRSWTPSPRRIEPRRGGVRRVLEGEVTSRDYRVRTSGGEVRIAFAMERRIQRDGKPHVMSVAIDVTDQRRAADELAHRDRLRSGVTAPPPPSWAPVCSTRACPGLRGGGDGAGRRPHRAGRAARGGGGGAGAPLTRGRGLHAPDGSRLVQQVLSPLADTNTWLSPLAQGIPVVTHRRSAPGPIRELPPKSASCR